MREIEPGDKPVELAVLVAGLVLALDGDDHAGRTGFLDRHAGCVMHADLFGAGLQVAVGPSPGGNHRPQAFLAQDSLAGDPGVGQQLVAVQRNSESRNAGLDFHGLVGLLDLQARSRRWVLPSSVR